MPDPGVQRQRVSICTFPRESGTGAVSYDTRPEYGAGASHRAVDLRKGRYLSGIPAVYSSECGGLCADHSRDRKCGARESSGASGDWKDPPDLSPAGIKTGLPPR